MGCIVPHVFYGSIGSEPTSRTRLLLDQRTPAEKEMSEEAKQKQRKIWAIACGTFLFLLIVAGIVFYLFFYDDMLERLSSDDEQPWSINNIKLLPGFKIMEYAKIPKARSLHVSPYGLATITYVGTNDSFVYAIVDFNTDSSNVATYQIWQSVASFTAFSIVVNEQQQTLYIDDMAGTVWRCPNVHEQVLSFENPADRLENCALWTTVPLGGQLHNTHYMTINPDGNLCMAFGIPNNIALPQPDSVEGTILCFNSYENPSIEDVTIYATGVRNSVGFDFHPDTQQLWFTDCGPDLGALSPNFPDDELNKVTTIGQTFGFPYCLTSGSGSVQQRDVGTTENIPSDQYGPDINNTCYVDEYTPAYQPLGPHVAPLGMKFIWSETLPSNRFILIAQHGSIYRNPPIGYRIMIAELGPGELPWDNIIDYKVFAEGWFDNDAQKSYGRPVDIEWFTHDDSFVVSDDERGVVYRIYYDIEDDVDDVESGEQN